MNSKLIIAFVVLSVIMAVSARIACPADFCSKVRCANASQQECEAKNEIYKEHGSMCGCCNVCLRKLNEGDSCAALLLIGGGPPKVACDTGLVCDRTKAVCVKK